MSLFFIIGCIDKGPQLSQTSSFGVEDQQLEGLSPHLQMDFEADVKSDLFCARGNVLLLGNGTLPYLMLNATLVGDGRTPLMRTKYLLLQIEPNRDYSFEISKNIRIYPGDYNCTMEVSGPRGTLALESRRCSLANPIPDSEPEQDLLSRNEEFAQQKAREEEAREEEAREEMAREEEARVESLQESEIAREAASKDPVAEKSVSNNVGNAGQNREAATKDGADATMTLPGKKEKGNGSLPAGAAKVEITTSGSEPMPASSSVNTPKTMLVGSSTSKKYHLSDCRYAMKIKPENRIDFESPEDAKRQGYLPCKSCNP